MKSRPSSKIGYPKAGDHIDVIIHSQVRSEYIPGKGLLCLSFSSNVQADHGRPPKQFRGLKQECRQRHETKRTIGYLIGIKQITVAGVIRPVQADIVFIARNRIQNKISKLGHDSSNVPNNTLIVFFISIMILLKFERDRPAELRNVSDCSSNDVCFPIHVLL